MKQVMEKEMRKITKSSVTPWAIPGLIALLFPLFAGLTYQHIKIQTSSTGRLLFEKGTALIRSFEAGTKTGLILRQWGKTHLQHLITETAMQRDILYILVADESGMIVAHNNPAFVGKRLGEGFPPWEKSLDAKWQINQTSEGKKVFTVYKKFLPGGQEGNQQIIINTLFGSGQTIKTRITQPEFNIFVGLDMTDVETARQSDERQLLFTGSVLFLIGISGIFLMFMIYNNRQTRASLTKIKAFSENLVENMPVGLITTDSTGMVTAMNPSALTILRIENAQLPEHRSAVLPEEISVFIDNIENNEKIHPATLLECRVAGSSLFLDVSAAPLYRNSGEISGYIILIKDMTELRHLQNEVVRTQKLATVGKLAAGVAHEIRNPLSSIKGFATYFKERYKERPEDQEIASILIQDTDRLNRVVSQLLEFARPVKPAPREISLVSFISDTVLILERQPGAKGIEIRFEPETFPETAWFDSDMMRQVLLNLYLNSIEAMGEKGVISVAVKRTGDNLVITVTDNGSGISKEDLGQILDPYFTTKSTGTGLGLAITNSIVESHGGEIKIASEVGIGTEVSVILPQPL
jgi:two-component system sensor histidine kinase HydH